MEVSPSSKANQHQTLVSILTPKKHTHKKEEYFLCQSHLNIPPKASTSTPDNIPNMHSPHFPPLSSPPSSDFYHHLLSGDSTAAFNHHHHHMGDSIPTTFPFYSHGESVEITDSPRSRALAASHNHKEAEKRRRLRINSHLDRLRSLLPCSSKTDKATLLAKVIQRLRELKQETSEITQLETFPSETDEITVLSNINSTDGRLIIKVSLCCEDRPDIISDLIETLKSLGLSLLTAEIVTFGGRVRNAIVVECVGDNENGEIVQYLKEALRSLVQRSGSNCGDRSKRRRIFDYMVK